MASKGNRLHVEDGTGNVFADLGFPHPEREELKAKLTLEIYRAIRGRGLSQTEAGKVLGIQQPHVSALMRGRSGNFSVARLFEFLNALGHDVEIAIRRARHGGKGAQTRVVLQS